MFTVDTGLSGLVHYVESDEFDLMIALYEKALEANHETECGKLSERLFWVQIYCSEAEFNAALQAARSESDEAAMQPHEMALAA